jgi:hypothetical protein
MDASKVLGLPPPHHVSSGQRRDDPQQITVAPKDRH